MKYTVVWTPYCLNQLARIWLAASDRTRVTQAAAQIDRELSLAPLQKGKEESEGLRRLRIPPLSVLFEVRSGDRIVEVVAVRRISVGSNGAAQ